MRCMPQVFGAVEHTLRHAREVLGAAINGVSDNPLIFGEDVLSGGNFHAEPIGFISDFLAIAVAELASTSERRIDLLDRRVNPNLNMFLADRAGPRVGLHDGARHGSGAGLREQDATRIRPRSTACRRRRARKTTSAWRRGPAASCSGSATTRRACWASNCSPPRMRSIACARSPRRRNCSACTQPFASACRTEPDDHRLDRDIAHARAPGRVGRALRAHSGRLSARTCWGSSSSCVAFGLLALLLA